MSTNFDFYLYMFLDYCDGNGDDWGNKDFGGWLREKKYSFNIGGHYHIDRLKEILNVN